VNEDGRVRRGVTERLPHLLGRQLDIAAACAHRHADGQRSQLGPESVTGDRVQHGERRPGGGLAGGATLADDANQ
jgi:hypothetical protein